MRKQTATKATHLVIQMVDGLFFYPNLSALSTIPVYRPMIYPSTSVPEQQHPPSKGNVGHPSVYVLLLLVDE